MARPLRFQYPGAIYHLMARGDGGKTVFETDDDRLVFLKRLEEVCGSCGWRVHAWVLMGNHFHLLLETPLPNLVTGMKSEGTKIDNLVQIGDNVVIGKHCLIVSQTGISGSTQLGDYVTCAGKVGIVGHVTVGSKAILSGRTSVTTSLPGDQVYAGKPAMPMREEMKLQALVRRLPRLIDRVKALEEALGKVG